MVSRFSQGIDSIWLDRIECNPLVDIRLIQCDGASSVRCTHSQDAAVVCSRNTSDNGTCIIMRNK